ncbi:putative heat shock 70 kDa protein [Paratrimastix pyriformis]|uniref:Heat shock 70 kDa protein n=1 Tax=Paratrimastix pyriformis TaxID=342808 RepID=A0ABQ8UL59_9EUKA|nr:putative heat shock 70 kDa protein [Paratrimastix pyriformis]
MGSLEHIVANWTPDSIIAIDFGTTRTGFSFYLPPFHSSEIRHGRWNGEKDEGKTPTALLLDEHDNIVSFGQMAQSTFFNSPEQGFRLFEDFKMKLWSSNSQSELVRPSLPDGGVGEPLPVLRVIAKSLEAVGREALKAVAQKLARQFNDLSLTNQLWVVTIPAIWKDSAKALMRQAALDGGLIDELNSNHLLLAYEPEAAAVRCLHETQLDLVEGTKFMVVDCGGGTVDITAHEIISGLRFKSLMVPTGGPWGSTYVDKNYFAFLRQFVGPEIYSQLSATQLMDLRLDWERVKLEFNGRNVNVNLSAICSMESFPPSALDRCLREFNAHPHFTAPFPEDRPTATASAPVDPSALRLRRMGFNLNLPPALTQQFFDPIFASIAQRVNQLLTVREVRGLKYIFLAGGFAQSEPLTTYLRAHVNTRGAAWTIPTMPTMSVVAGAARMGTTPDIVDSHKAALYYGVVTSNLVYSDAEHPGRPRRYGDDGTKYVDVVAVLVEKGQNCRRGDQAASSFIPMTKDQETVTFRMVCSSERCTYPDAALCKDLAQVSIPCPGAGRPPAERPVTATMSFAGTEIEFSATNAEGHREAVSVTFA